MKEGVETRTDRTDGTYNDRETRTIYLANLRTPGAGRAISGHPHIYMPLANLSSSLAAAVSECYMVKRETW
jgi:hypothetical protein